MIKRILFLFFLSCIYFSGFIFPQNKDSIKTYNLNDVVVVANKFESKLKDVANKIELIDKKKIENANGNRLPDIIKNSSAVFLKSYGTTSSLQTISINGLGAEHTLILIDGVKINSLQNAQVDLSLIPMESVAKIEIMPNGSSSIYGSEALGGVINIITNDRISNNPEHDFQLNTSLSAGSFNTFRYAFNFYKQFNSFDLRAYYNREKSAGNYKYYYDNGINLIKKERENASYSLYDLGIHMQYIWNASNRLRFISTLSNQDKNVPGIETGTPSSLTKQKDRNLNNILYVENILSRTLSLNTSFNYQNNLEHYNIEPLTHSYYKNSVYSLNPELKWSNENNNLVFGYNYLYGNLNSNEIEDLAQRNQHAVYLSSGIFLFKGLQIFPSARFDYFSDINKKVVTYKLGFNYQPIRELDLSLKANAGKNFRAPTFNDLYWKESGNPDLKPENSFNAEAGIIYLFENLLDGQFEITYTYINAKDKIVWTPQRNLLWAPFNISKSESNNFLFNLSLNKKFNDDYLVRFDSGLNLVHSRKTDKSYTNDPTEGKYFIYVPLQTIKLGLMFEFNFLSLNLFYTHIGTRYSDLENKRSLNPYNLLDGNISCKMNFWHLEEVLKLEVNNLTNTRYEVISGYPMPLQNYTVNLIINY